MAIDAGGARMRERAWLDENNSMIREAAKAKPVPNPETTVKVAVQETHNGEPCECIDEKEMVLRIGDTVELTHTCHDGRVDVVSARILSVSVATPTVEHGSVKRA